MNMDEFPTPGHSQRTGKWRAEVSRINSQIDGAVDTGMTLAPEERRNEEKGQTRHQAYDLKQYLWHPRCKISQ